MADHGSIPPRGEGMGREASESTIGPGSSISHQGQSAGPSMQSRRQTMVQRDPSATMSYIPSEMDTSGVSVTDYSSAGEEDGEYRHPSIAGAVAQGQAGPAPRASLHRAAFSQTSTTTSNTGMAAPSGAKGKRRASVAPRERGTNERDRDVSRSRSRMRNQGSDDDNDDDDGKYGPLDDEDDEVHHVDRGEQLVRRRMKARQKEKALRLKLEKDKQRELMRSQGLQPQQTSQQATAVSPRLRHASRQMLPPTPSPHVEREGRPLYISLPPPQFGSAAPAAGASTASPYPVLSPNVRGATSYPSPHSHIRRPSTQPRTSMLDPAASDMARQVSHSSTANHSSTVAAPSHGQTTPQQIRTSDVFSEAALDDGNELRSMQNGTVGGEQDEMGEQRDTLGSLSREGGIQSRAEMDEEAEAEEDEENFEPQEGGEDSGETSGGNEETNSEGDVEYTLKDRQDAINIEHPFGLPIWKPALYKKSRTVTRNAESALHSIPSAAAEGHLLPVNLLWTIFAGFWLSIVCFVLAIVVNLLPFGGCKYARIIWELGGYLFWPFGKYVECEVDPGSKERMMTYAEEQAESAAAGPGLSPMPEESYENLFTPVAARYPHDHTHTVFFNTRTTPRAAPRTCTAADQAAEDQKRSSGSGSGSGGEEPGSISNEVSGSTTVKSYGAAKDDGEGEVEPYTDAERIRQESDIYGYVEDNEGHEVGVASRFLGTLAYGIAFWLIIAPLMGLVCLACWFTVFPIPMAKLNWVLLKNLARRPLALRFRSAPGMASPVATQQQRDGANASESTPLLGHKRSLLQQLKAGEPAPQTTKQSRDGRLERRSRILVCTYRAMGLQYYKYTVGGVNILFINTLPFVFFTIFDFLVIEPYVERHHIDKGLLAIVGSKSSMFVFGLGSVIPLSYFIGMAVASISAQSSIGMGAVINATFGSIIEIILYAIALTQDKARLVEGSIVGSILAGVLLMPGVSMCSGAMRRKEQRFNARSAGVTSTMLIMAIIGILTPTLFYQIYGTFQLTCKGCPHDARPGESWTCKRCFYEHVPPATDPFYQSNVKGLMYTCTVVLVLSYGIGLWFSLRTHASQIWQNPQPHAVLPPAQHGGAQTGHALPGHQTGSQPYGTVTSVGATATLPSQAGQRTSLYKRILPGNVLHQLLPGSNRASTLVGQTVRSHQNRGTMFSEATRDDGPPPLHLPDSLTADEYERALLGHGQAQASQMGSMRSSGTAVPRPPAAARHSSILSHDYGHAATAGSTAGTVVPAHGHHHEVAQNEAAPGGHGGHDAPSWTRVTSMFVLISCTVLYAFIAEILVDAVDVVLDGSGLDIKLLGVTLFALVPNATEFMNAMSFAINGNIALSMEIGSAYALQVCLIQIPAMVAFSAFYQAQHSHDSDISSTFTLIFPRWDVIAIIFAIFLLTYTYIESRSNYFRGSLCILSYVVLISGFVFAPNTGDPESPVEDHPGRAALFSSTAIAFGGLQMPPMEVPWSTYLSALFHSLWTR